MEDKSVSVTIPHSFNLLNKTLSHKPPKLLWIEIAFYLYYAFTKSTTGKKLIGSLLMAKKQPQQIFGLKHCFYRSGFELGFMYTELYFSISNGTWKGKFGNI